MISPIDRFTSVPNVAEAVTSGDGFDIQGAPNAFVWMLTNIPCGFAKTIEVFFVCPGDSIQHVVIKNYAGNRTVNVVTQLTGAVAANNTVSVTFNGPFGQSYDIGVQLKGGVATPAGTLAKMWTAAKA